MIFLPLIIVAAVLLAVFRWVTVRGDNRFYRWAWVAFLAGVFLLFWVNGAVGIIGASNNDVNMLYNALLGLGVLAAIVLKGRSLVLAMLMLVMDFFLCSLLAVAWVMDWGISGPKWPYDALLLTVFFSLLWSVAAVLFYVSYRHRLRMGIS